MPCSVNSYDVLTTEAKVKALPVVSQNYVGLRSWRCQYASADSLYLSAQVEQTPGMTSPLKRGK